VRRTQPNGPRITHSGSRSPSPSHDRCKLAAAAWPFAARAQQDRIPVISILRVNPKNISETFAEPFRRYMKALGWDEGRNIRYQFVWADGNRQ
jgi:hypothetical protein